MTPLRALLVARAFELWTHENDIRLTSGLSLEVPDAAHRSGMRQPARVRLVLTGLAGAPGMSA